MTFDKSIIASNIKILRKRKNFTQQKLADYLGHKSDTIISNWETKRTEPGWEDIKKMAVLFDVKEDEITGKENPNQDIKEVLSEINRHLTNMDAHLKEIASSGIVSCPYESKVKRGR